MNNVNEIFDVINECSKLEMDVRYFVHNLEENENLTLEIGRTVKNKDVFHIVVLEHIENGKYKYITTKCLVHISKMYKVICEMVELYGGKRNECD